MHLKTLKLTLKSVLPVEEAATKLRGFCAMQFNEYALLHQHVDVDKLLYKSSFTSGLSRVEEANPLKQELKLCEIPQKNFEAKNRK